MAFEEGSGGGCGDGHGTRSGPGVREGRPDEVDGGRTGGDGEDVLRKDY